MDGTREREQRLVRRFRRWQRADVSGNLLVARARLVNDSICCGRPSGPSHPRRDSVTPGATAYP